MAQIKDGYSLLKRSGLNYSHFKLIKKKKKNLYRYTQPVGFWLIPDEVKLTSKNSHHRWGVTDIQGGWERGVFLQDYCTQSNGQLYTQPSSQSLPLACPQQKFTGTKSSPS